MPRSFLMSRTSRSLTLLLAIVTAGVFSGCGTIKGTTDATTNLTGATKDLLSSTTPGAWFTDKGTLRPEYRALAFTALNFENLRADMAEGEGEYLASFAVLLGISPDQRAGFFADAQDAYPHLFAEGITQRESFERLFTRYDINPNG